MPDNPEAASFAASLGGRVRELREEQGLSLRELARRVGCSASLLSQVERGLTAPTAGVVYALARELAVSLDHLFGAAGAGHEQTTIAISRPTGVLRRADRRAIDLATGVRWERLTPDHDTGMELLEVVYQPDGESTDDGTSVRHDGHEYLIVLEGVLEAHIGFDTVTLSEGDSLAFDPTVPHRYRNPGPGQARCHSLVTHGPCAV